MSNACARARARFLLFFSKSCIVFLLFSGSFHSHLWHFDGISSSLSFVFYSVSSLHFFRSFAVFFIYLHTAQFSSFTRHPLPSLSLFLRFHLPSSFDCSLDSYCRRIDMQARGRGSRGMIVRQRKGGKKRKTTTQKTRSKR